MSILPKKLQQQLEQRKSSNTFRQLNTSTTLVDFSSNDYLGFATSEVIFERTHQYLKTHRITENGATGSRLLSGNHKLYNVVEDQLCMFHDTKAALVFNSGYTANLGFFSSVPRRGDIILYDEWIHASIRDGIQLSNAKAYKFKHNDLADLKRQIEQHGNHSECEIYVVTESVFSMDGDSPDLKTLSELCKTKNCRLIIDEAHALGIFGKHGCGLVQHLDIQNNVFARIVTFGKALGCHGAAILGCHELKDYLVNFSRPFIYTTGLSPHALATIHTAYTHLNSSEAAENMALLSKNSSHFKAEATQLGLKHRFIDSNSAIQCCIVSGNDVVKQLSKTLKDNNFDVKPILSPTVPKNKERLRFCLHSYNTTSEITDVLKTLSAVLE